MEFKIKCDLDHFLKILHDLNFVIKNKAHYTSATRKTRFGRYHLLVKNKDRDQIFCEFHFDRIFHFLFIGVNYGKKPQILFEKELKQRLVSANLLYNSRTINWFNRTNRALLTGFKLAEEYLP